MIYRLLALIAALTVTATPAFARTLTGEGKTLPFPAGSNVVGAVIELEGHPKLYGCHLYDAQVPGKVTSGVIGPWDGEMAQFRPCFGADGSVATDPPAQPTINGLPRRLSSDYPENKMRFEAGESVIGGWLVFDNNGGAMGPCYVINSQVGGWVHGGAANFWDGEQKSFRPCFG